MLYTGTDLHKKYSVACTRDASAQCVREARIDHAKPDALRSYFASLGQPSRVVLEACWNWGWLHDQLSELDKVGLDSKERGSRCSRIGVVGLQQLPRAGHGLRLCVGEIHREPVCIRKRFTGDGLAGLRGRSRRNCRG
jgi:hypothetical protein